MSDTQEQLSKPIHIVVMGVAGSGKSTVAEALRDRLGLTMAEGDDFHPQANIDKMSQGIPLTDADRRPWLEVINRWMLGRNALGESTVVSSSALKRSYRDILRKDVPVFFVHLVGSQELIQRRLSERKGHFMPPALLPSQFADLEPLQPDEPGIEVSVEGTSEEMIQRSIDAVKAHAEREESQTSEAIADKADESLKSANER
ncbi:gluconokinase [Bifidobacterium aquikefiri]|uniref:gluconokinase n=1 Tax=Bifidobacterium aquikefiri TaxID=1653207 RepID=UPI0039E8C5A3